MDTVICGSCGIELVEPLDSALTGRAPCPGCQSLTRTFDKTPLCTSQQGYVTLRGVIPTTSLSKWRIKFWVQQTFDRAHQVRAIWARTKVRGGMYTETVTNAETGEILHHVSHPLADHKGHGSDKKRKLK